MPAPAKMSPPPYLSGGLLHPRWIPPARPPWYAVNANNPCDQYFTKRNVARDCWRSLKAVAREEGVDLGRHVFVEPSAGEGCFINHLPRARRIALDILPPPDGHAETRQADFLKWSPPPELADKRFAVIGNPPFGVRGALALEFLNRAALFADIIGFILPMTFASDGKGGALTRVHPRLSLLHSEELPSSSFYEAGSCEDRDINTVWQVWGALATPRPRPVSADCSEFADIRAVCTAPNRRCGLALMDDYDFFLQGTFYDNHPPRVVKNFAEVKYGSGYGIIIRKNKRGVSAALKNADWVRHSARSTNHCRHIRMRHIREVLTAAGFAKRGEQ